MVFGLGPFELLVILGVAIFFYGGKRLSQVGEGLGKSVSEFKKAIQPSVKPSSHTAEELTSASEPPHKVD